MVLLKVLVIVLTCVGLGVFMAEGPLQYPRGGRWSLVLEFLAPLLISTITSFIVICRGHKRTSSRAALVGCIAVDVLTVLVFTAFLLSLATPIYCGFPPGFGKGDQAETGQTMPNHMLHPAAGGRLGPDFVRTLAHIR